VLVVLYCPEAFVTNMWFGVGYLGKYSSAPEPEGGLVFDIVLYIGKQAGREDTIDQFYSL
jgi:hypothetical protein